MSSSTQQNVKEEVLLQIPGCRDHLVDDSETLELAYGEFKLVKVSDNDVIVRVGLDLQWPVVKDEPVVKVNAHDCLFSLLVKDGDPLRYRVTFSGEEDGDVVKSLEFLEEFMRENSCFSSSSKNNNNEIDWKEFAPKPEEYKSVVAKAIAGGTGHIIKGIFTCSNTFSKKVHKGGSEITITKEPEEKSSDESQINGDNNGNKKNNTIITNLQRAEKLWKASETIVATMLDGGEMVSDLMMAPVLKSKLGKAFLSTAPGEVLLVSLDSFNKIVGAAEAAGTQTYSATSMAATELVSKSLGEDAGKTTGKILETTGSLGRTAWNVQKALDPSFSITSEIVKNAPRQ